MSNTLKAKLIPLSSMVSDLGEAVLVTDHIWFAYNDDTKEPPAISIDSTPHITESGAHAVTVYQDGRPIALAPVSDLDVLKKADLVVCGYFNDNDELYGVDVKVKWLPAR